MPHIECYVLHLILILDLNIYIEDIIGFMETERDAAIKLARLGLDNIDSSKSYSGKNLTQFEYQYCYEFEEATFQLRKSRKMIYNK